MQCMQRGKNGTQSTKFLHLFDVYTSYLLTQSNIVEYYVTDAEKRRGNYTLLNSRRVNCADLDIPESFINASLNAVAAVKLSRSQSL